MQIYDLRRLQLTELEILKEVAQICENNNLNYFLYGGSLLGAVRHKGFIPWDDDLDIAMPREDYERFISICKSELSPEYFLHCVKTDKNYWLAFAKIRVNGTAFEESDLSSIDTHKGIYIDIFPLDNVKKQRSIAQTIQGRLVLLLKSVIFKNRVVHIKEKPNLKWRLIYFLGRPFRIEFLQRVLQKVMTANSNEASNYFVSLGSHYKYYRQTIPKNRFFPAARIEFEGVEFKAPHDWNYVLKQIYNNYMEPPPEEKRVNHNPVDIKFAE